METKQSGSEIVVVGSCNIDLIAYTSVIPAPGQTVMGDDFEKGFGGKGANQAVMVAKLGGKVSMVAKVGKDIFGEETKNNFLQFGMDLKHFSFSAEKPSGVALISVDKRKGMNSIIVVAGANNELSEKDVLDAAATISSANIVLCQLEVPLATTFAALKLAKQHGVKTILNPAPATTLPESIYPLIDIICPNETEAETLTGICVDSIERATLAGNELIKRGAKVAVITLGERGCLIVEQGKSHLIPAEKVNAIDTTGAGDCFIGSMAFFLSRGSTLEVACQKANIVAAYSVQHRGTQKSFPDSSLTFIKTLLEK